MNTRIGMFGCGKQGEKHVAGLKKIPGVEVVVADANAELARSFAERFEVSHAEPDDIFSDSTISAVDIATPPDSHVPLIEQAVSSGRHYFCEKPLCLSSGEAEHVAGITRDSGLVGMVGYVYRFAPAFELGKQIVGRGADSAIGKPVSATFRIGGRGGHQLWKHTRASGGGAMNEMLVHMLDLAIWFFGAPGSASMLDERLLRETRPVGGKMQKVDAEDFVIASFDSEEGPAITIQADLITPAFTQFVEVQGENGTFVGSIQGNHPAYVFCIDAKAGYDAGRTDLKPEGVNLFDAQMAEFVQAVRDKNPAAVRCSAADSVALMKAIDQLR